MSYHVRECCSLCGGDIDKVLDLGSTPIANEYPDEPAEHQDVFPLYLAACRDCGHLQMPVVIDPERLYREYRYVSGTTIQFRLHMDRVASRAIETVPLKPNALVVDIGSNDGTLLRAFKDRGMRVLGVDPAQNLAADACDSGVPTLPAFFEPDVANDVKRLCGTADCVTALNVFAHTENLREIAIGVKHLLTKGGAFLVEVGSSASIVDGVFDLCYHEHQHFHHLSPLSRLMDSVGLVVASAETVNSQGGSIRAWIRHAETSPGIVAERPVVNWEAVRANVEQRRLEIRSAVLSAGRVGLYGVPAKATTLLHYCGLTDAIAVAYDDNPLKVGRYVPGTNIPIRPVEELHSNPTNALLLASWNFADEIMTKRAAFRGKWIVPFPEVRVA